MSPALRFNSQVLGGPQFRADLESLQIGLSRKLTELRRQAADELAQRAATFVPLGPGPQSEKDNLPHIRDTIKGRAQGVVAFHPAGLVTEFGGTIKPRGVGIQIPARHQAVKALEVEFARVEQLLASAVDDLIASNVR